jgi:hypothetical protein
MYCLSGQGSTPQPPARPKISMQTLQQVTYTPTDTTYARNLAAINESYVVCVHSTCLRISRTCSFVVRGIGFVRHHGSSRQRSAKSCNISSPCTPTSFNVLGMRNSRNRPSSRSPRCAADCSRPRLTRVDRIYSSDQSASRARRWRCALTRALYFMTAGQRTHDVCP